MKIECEDCKHHPVECNAAMDYPICLTEGECEYEGEREDGFCYSMFEPKSEILYRYKKKRLTTLK